MTAPEADARQPDAVGPLTTAVRVTQLGAAADGAAPRQGEGPASVPRGGRDDRDPTTVVFRVPSPIPGPDLLEVRCRSDRPTSVIHLAWGELCAYTAPLLAQFLDGERGAGDIVLDTSGVTFIDSTGIGTILDLSERWRQRGRTMQIANPSAVVCRVVTLLGWEEALFSPAPPLARDDEQAPDERPSRPVDVTVRNADRGQTIEVVVDGTIDATAAAALARRLEILSVKRQPATLRLDLADASGADEPTFVRAVTTAAVELADIGSRLVVIGAEPKVVGAVATDEAPPSLAFEEAGPPAADREPTIDLDATPPSFPKDLEPAPRRARRLARQAAPLGSRSNQNVLPSSSI
jgi:anti-sigma B factor antagonist